VSTAEGREEYVTKVNSSDPSQEEIGTVLAYLSAKKAEKQAREFLMLLLAPDSMMPAFSMLQASSSTTCHSVVVYLS
jgi:hypothetical protein